MTETYLRTRTHSLGYALTALVFLLVSMQSARYGFYSLFYGGLLIAVLGAAGLSYTWTMRRQQLKAPGHLWLLTGMTLVLTVTALQRPELAAYWLFPLIILNLLILPIRKGLLLCLLAIVLMGAVFVFTHRGLAGFSLLVAVLLLGGAAGLFAYRYHHHARSVVELSSTDPVTGAFNLRFFDETLAQEISRSEATGRPLSLIKLALDFYDELADLHGSGRLQSLLQGVSDQIKQMIRAGDSHYHAGDGSFLLLLPDTPEEGVRVIAERIRRGIAEQTWPTVDRLTASLGCTTRGEGEMDADAVAQRAERALAQAQKRGHDQIWHLGAGN
ncbi:GGDEF domain-containing protein [Marinobacteraceae bacterium S3BR75-40.1]